MKQERFKIGIICGKLGDVDGVSLETSKWIDALNESGHEIYTFAGYYATELKNVNPDRQFVLEEIRFDSHIQRQCEKLVFPYINSVNHEYAANRDIDSIMEKVEACGTQVSNDIYSYIQKYGIDFLIAENTNALPMTIVGAAAVYQLSVNYRIATLFHHHDFWWERSRFSHSRIDNFLQRVMPPNDPGLEHVVISSYSQHVLSVIQRIKPFLIFNCEDFEVITQKDDYNAHLREDIGIGADDILVLQPTRIVPRKRIQDSIKFIGKLQEKFPEFRGRIKFVISLYQGDEPNNAYMNSIEALAKKWDIEMLFISEWVSAVRGSKEGRRVYSNRDVLAQADLVLYLPIWEGFGNALLEALATRVPVVTTTYLVYKTDIKTVGFRNIEIRDQYDKEGSLIIPDSILTYAHHILTHPEAREKMVEYNFQLAKREFGLPVLKEKLDEVVAYYADEIRASQKRREKQGMDYSV